MGNKQCTEGVQPRSTKGVRQGACSMTHGLTVLAPVVLLLQAGTKVALQDTKGLQPLVSLRYSHLCSLVVVGLLVYGRLQLSVVGCPCSNRSVAIPWPHCSTWTGTGQQ